MRLFFSSLPFRECWSRRVREQKSPWATRHFNFKTSDSIIFSFAHPSSLPPQNDCVWINALRSEEVSHRVQNGVVVRALLLLEFVCDIDWSHLRSAFPHDSRRKRKSKKRAAFFITIIALANFGYTSGTNMHSFWSKQLFLVPSSFLKSCRDTDPLWSNWSFVRTLRIIVL